MYRGSISVTLDIIGKNAEIGRCGRQKAVYVSNLGNFPAIGEVIRVEAPAQEESKERC